MSASQEFFVLVEEHVTKYKSNLKYPLFNSTNGDYKSKTCVFLFSNNNVTLLYIIHCWLTVDFKLATTAAASANRDC